MSEPDLPALIGQCLGEIGRLAYLFAGEEEAVVELAIAEMREQLGETIPPDTVEQFVGALLRCKAEIERRGIVGSVSRH